MKDKDEDFWKKKLTPEQYEILREKGTEAPFTGELLHNKETGMYVCAACGAPLFSSETKFDSGTGWPSFYDVVGKGNVELRDDTSHNMQRTEVACATCGGHLGHVFDDLSRQAKAGLSRQVEGRADGPGDKTGKRYCINSCALDFKKK